MVRTLRKTAFRLILAAALGGLAYVLSTLFGFPVVNTLQLDQTELEIHVLLENLEIPWDMQLSTDGWIWFSEKKGKISRYSLESGRLQEVYFIDDVFQSWDNSGLHALALHPDFPNSPFVYAHYAFELQHSRLVRFRFNSATQVLEEYTVLLEDLPANASHMGSRIIFSAQGDKLFLSIGDVYNPDQAQDLASPAGKILRMNLDGSIPEDNPFPGSLVWSYGHRNPQGLVLASNGKMYSSEHGSVFDDELNLIKRGRNYGHPKVRGFCDLKTEKGFCSEADVKEPLMTWSPTFAVAGIEYYDHPAIPEWQNSILITSLKNGRAREGKRLQVAKLTTEGNNIVAVEDYLVNAFGRLREVMAGPDGRIFLFTSNRERNSHKPRIPNLSDDRLIMLQSKQHAD